MNVCVAIGRFTLEELEAFLEDAKRLIPGATEAIAHALEHKAHQVCICFSDPLCTPTCAWLSEKAELGSNLDQQSWCCRSMSRE